MILIIYLWRYISTIQCYLISLLGLTAIVGDILVHVSKKHVYRALFDNTTHAIIGGLSWLIVCFNYRGKSSLNTVLEIISCTMISSLIDLDHFFIARTLSLKEATSLKHRPPLHCTTIPLVITPLLLLISYIFDLHSLQRFSLILFTAFMTHHTRDATRRGYWLYPFGSTQPIPYFMYVLMTLLMPYVICGIMNLLKVKRSVSYNLEVI